MFKKLLRFCLVVAIVGSDTTEEDSNPIATPRTTSSSVIPALEELKKLGANPKNKGVALRSSDSLFGLGIGANLLGVHAGAGIGHGRRGYGDMDQGFVGKPAGGQYPQYPKYPYPYHIQNMPPQPYSPRRSCTLLKA